MSRKYFLGIELEMSKNFTSQVDTGIILKEFYSKNPPDPKAQKRMFNYVSDSSCGGEFVSDVLSDFNGGMKNVLDLCDIVENHRNKIGIDPCDASCGLHFHFGITNIEAADTTQLIRNLFILLKQFEPIIYMSNPAPRLPQNNNRGNTKYYCYPIDVIMSQMIRVRDILDVKQAWFQKHNEIEGQGHQTHYTKEFLSKISHKPHRYDRTRYHGINLASLFRMGTIEFRYMCGTFDKDKVMNAYNLFHHMMEFSRNTETDSLLTDRLVVSAPEMLDWTYFELMEYINKIGMVKFTRKCFDKFDISQESRTYLLSRMRKFNGINTEEENTVEKYKVWQNTNS